MITELSFGNFKSWKRVEKMRFAPITGLFGTNSSGKTSILQLLLMIKQTVESTDRLQVLDFGNEKSPANLGSFREVIYSHDTSGALDWNIRWKLNQRLVVKQPDDKKAELFSGDEIGFQVEITENEKRRLF
jgi:AAA15 family ATPase/GTPase